MSHVLQAIVEAASLNEDGKQRKVVVTGCLAQRYSEQLAADLPEADLVMGFQNYGDLSNALRAQLGMEAASPNTSRVQVGCWPGLSCIHPTIF